MENNFRSNIEYLRKIKGISYAGIGLQADCSANTVSYWIHKNTEPKMIEVERLARFFEIPIQELLYSNLSKGNLIEKSEQSENVPKGNLNGNLKGNLISEPAQIVHKWGDGVWVAPKVVVVGDDREENIVFVDLKARAGYLNGYGDMVWMGKQPSFRLPNLPSGSYRAFEVEGLSMYPTLKNTDIAITRAVETLDDVADYKIYVIITAEHGIVIKRLLNRLKTDNRLVLISDSPEFPPIVVIPDQVLEIWQLVRYIATTDEFTPNLPQEVWALKAQTAIMAKKLDEVLAKMEHQ